jgi:hypothetical protein
LDRPWLGTCDLVVLLIQPCLVHTMVVMIRCFGGPCPCNYIPQNFLPGPGLSREEAFTRMEASAREKLAKLGLPIPDDLMMTLEDRDREIGENTRRSSIERQTTPVEAAEKDSYELAEAVALAPPGYFYPGMPETRQRQLAAIISAATPQIVDQNTPGTASTSTARFLC